MISIAVSLSGSVDRFNIVTAALSRKGFVCVFLIFLLLTAGPESLTNNAQSGRAPESARPFFDSGGISMTLDSLTGLDIDDLLSEYPVKLGAIAKRLGVKVLLSTLPRGTSGQITWEDGGFVIRVNRHESEHRQRFTVAHELAHCVLHADLIRADGVWRENVLRRCGKPIELDYQANRMASYIVMPRRLFDEVVLDYADPADREAIADIARRFKVPQICVANRL